MTTTKEKTSISINKAVERAVPHYLCKPEEWYNRKDIMNKLEEINPFYLVSDQTFYGWIGDITKELLKTRTYYILSGIIS